ncbi:MAG: alkaline phosphatase D family protein [Flavisolibacter sp.]
MKMVLLILLSFSAMASNSEKLANLKTIKRFVFGSCNNQNKPQPLWSEMLKEKPDLFLWGGDIVYADKEKTNLVRAYEKQSHNKEWLKFKDKIPYVGIWDDHDYGINDGDWNNPFKKDAQKMLLDFLEEPENSSRRKQEGVYTSYDFGRVKFILLDNRYFFKQQPGSEMLGEEQWKWLENEVNNSHAKVTFVMTGLSILSPQHPFGEGWPFYPSERDRLLRIMDGQKNSGVIYLTGDMHFASIFRRHDHLEFLSSGMTHVTPRIAWWYLGRRYETSFFGLNYGLVDINWDGETPIVTMSIRNRTGAEFHKRTFRLDGNEWVEETILIGL